ncbi:MAG TPA: GatB/YqeY domain-containing protein [Candidatus Eisenbacteria bacterium]|nr:GatB/YqeY domain-containing protein [Candidatus Eisenbacteria bacterium]
MLEERLEQDMKAALKAGEADRLSTLRMMRSQILLEKKKDVTRQTLTEDEVTAVINAYAKKLRESAAEYEKLGRPAEAGKIREELRVVEGYLPQRLTETEARDLVKQVLTELQLTSIKEFGRAMKEVQARAKGRADGKLLSEIVRASLD